MGDNGGPPLDPPEPPKEPPKDKASRTQAAKALAKQIALQALRRAGPIGAAFMAIEAGHWLYTEYPSIRSYQDEPKTLAELQQNAGKRRPGYEDHHIVEQGAGGRERFSRSQIESSDNVVSVPNTGIMRSRVGITSLTRTSACRPPATICAGRTGPSMSGSGT
jgi:hypothetical protein